MILLALPLIAIIAAAMAVAFFGDLDEEEMKKGYIRENLTDEGYQDPSMDRGWP